MNDRPTVRPPREFGQPTYTLSEIGGFAASGIGRLTRWAFLCSILAGIVLAHMTFSIKDTPLVSLTLADIGGEIARWCFSYAIGKPTAIALISPPDDPPPNYTQWAKALPWLAVGGLLAAALMR